MSWFLRIDSLLNAGCEKPSTLSRGLEPQLACQVSDLAPNQVSPARDQPNHTHDYSRDLSQTTPAPSSSCGSESPQITKPTEHSNHSFVRWHRHRRLRACQSCHNKKIKCIGDGAKCNNCNRARLQCAWTPMKKRGPKPKLKAPGGNIAATQPSTDTSFDELMRRFYSDEVPQDTRDAIVYYLDYFYGICPIFHPATLVRRVLDGKVEQILIDAMRASAARIITKHTGRSVDVDKAIEVVQQKLMLDLEAPSLDYVRAVVLLASLNGGECRFMSYNSLSCLAASLVIRLGWHTIDLVIKSETSWDDWAAAELKRRTFWVVYEIDSYQSLLGDRPMTISESRLHISPPGADCSWDDMAAQQGCCGFSQYQANLPKSEIVRTGYTLHSFVETCNLAALISRINTFLWDVRVDLSGRSGANMYAPSLKYLEPPQAALMQKPEQLKNLFDYPRFAELSRMLVGWRDDLVPADDMKGLWKSEHHFSTFGSLEHRHFIMRIRYFCLYTYSVPVLHILHFANRPSFFAKGASYSSAADLPNPALALAAADSIENSVIREMLSAAFSDLLNDGLLAYDIVEESWDICLEAVHDVIAFMDRNSDIPLDRCDQVMPLCLFTSITVLIRQIRRCRSAIETKNMGLSKKPALNPHDELTKNVLALRRLWAMLKDLDLIWRIDGMELLL
ncbi:hypothetical protein EV174_004606, partial [Coemansia sp. RSA 2320]